jgi:hypothetical protein
MAGGHILTPANSTSIEKCNAWTAGPNPGARTAVLHTADTFWLVLNCHYVHEEASTFIEEEQTTKDIILVILWQEFLMSNRLITQLLHQPKCSLLCRNPLPEIVELLWPSVLLSDHELTCFCTPVWFTLLIEEACLCMCGGGGGSCTQNEGKHVPCLVYLTLKLCDCF